MDPNERTPILVHEPRDGAVTAPLQRFGWPETPAGDDPEKPAALHAALPVRWNELQVVAQDRSQPAGVLFRWAPVPCGPPDVTYELRISRAPDFLETLVLAGLLEPRVEVLHLHIATRYYWQVIARADGRTVAESKILSFLTHDAVPRWISVPGITNVRDLGGWPLPGGRRVRQGLLYRSSEMNSHVSISPDGKRILEEILGIRTDLDLRGAGEEARPVLDPDRVQWINIPVQPYDAIADPAYQSAYRRLFSLFANPDRYPILFHCWGGADRAGTVAFLLSALLGKSPHHLMMDYELTSLSVWGERSRWSREFQTLLHTLGRYGKEVFDLQSQAENYLLSIGVQPEEIARIRSILIAPDSAAG